MRKKIWISVASGFIVFFLIIFNVQSTVYIERTLNTTPDRLWLLWNSADSIQKWWGPKDYTAPAVQNELRVGGTFLFAMRSPSGETHYNGGTYTEVIPNQKIVSSMHFADELGRKISGSDVPVPGRWSDTVTITVEFQDLGGKTLVSIKEEGIPLIMQIFAKMGWQQQFDKLEALL